MRTCFRASAFLPQTTAESGPGSPPRAQHSLVPVTLNHSRGPLRWGQTCSPQRGDQAPCSARRSSPCPCSVRREPLSGSSVTPTYTVAAAPRGPSDFPAELLDPTLPRGLGASGVLPLLELWLIVDTGYPSLAMRPKASLFTQRTFQHLREPLLVQAPGLGSEQTDKNLSSWSGHPSGGSDRQ